MRRKNLQKADSQHYSLLNYTEITFLRKQIKEKIITTPQLLFIISRSDLMKILMNQDTRYSEFYGQPEFKNVLLQFGDDIRNSKQERVMMLIYNVITDKFDEDLWEERRNKGVAEKVAIQSFFIKNLKNTIIRDTLVPFSKMDYPMATDYTTELLVLFHKSAGYSRRICKYMIEDIADHINHAYSMLKNTRHAKNKTGREKNCSLKVAYKLWQVYAPFGESPRFRDEKNRERLIKNETKIINQFCEHSIKASADVIISSDLDYNVVVETAKKIFTTKQEMRLFFYWFNAGYFDNNCKSSSSAQLGTSERMKEIEELGYNLEARKWSVVQKDINKQRAKLISALRSSNLINFDSLSAYPTKYTNKLLKLAYENDKQVEKAKSNYSQTDVKKETFTSINDIVSIPECKVMSLQEIKENKITGDNTKESLFVSLEMAKKTETRFTAIM